MKKYFSFLIILLAIPIACTRQFSVSPSAPVVDFTATPTSSFTPTWTPIFTSTETPTPSQTATETPTSTVTFAWTFTGTPTPTDTLPAPADTFTATETPTDSPTGTSTDTPTHTSTDTPVNTLTETPTDTPIDTSTNTPTDTPTSTTTSTPTATPTPTATLPMGIYWNQADLNCSAGAIGMEVRLNLSVNQLPESTAGVTLSGPGVNIPLTCWGDTADHSIYLEIISGTGCQPGQSYTLTTVTSIGTAYATLMAPGGNLSLTPDGSQLSWDFEGNEDYVSIWQEVPGTTTYWSGWFFPDIVSTFSIPNSAYPDPGTYRATARIQNATNSVVGAAPGTRFTIHETKTFYGITR